ncbi:MAG: CHAD domain-containing protein [Planctomycetes bacterium]|nr:CHAD domain-containing protein [Planctomycetota bacterium]
MTRKLPANPRVALAPVAARLLAELRKVRKDLADDEAVHDARVAARRLAAIGELWLAAGATRDKLERRLEKCVRRLGRVRNLDVAIELLREGPPEDAGARRMLEKRARRKRREERARLRGWLTPGRLKRIKSALVAAVTGSSTASKAPTPAALAPRLRSVLGLAGHGRPMDDAARAHELRREIRVLRYQQQAISACYPLPEDRALQALFVRLQDAAGGWHDRFQLNRLAEKAAAKMGDAAQLAEFRRRLATEMLTLAGKFETALADLVGLGPILAGRARTGSAGKPE